MKKHSLLLFFLTSVLCLRVLDAHCQVPCGIYDDHARVHIMLEDAETIAKACKQINELAGEHDAQSQQQLVRWVNNKEIHAQKVITTMCDYYLTQRIKPQQEDYLDRLEKHHAVILAAMKAKQHSEVQYATSLLEAIQALMEFYPHH
jgi:nickel superoxide dismutase